MHIKVNVRAAELSEMHMTKEELHAHVVATLDEADPQLSGFDVDVEINN